MSVSENQSRRPVNVLSGFLGSGKTTLLRRLLHSEAMANCAVLINEFGSVGLDHFLVEETGHDLVVLPNGCVCCALRGDLEKALLNLLQRETDSNIRFDRVLIETTGVADPGPIAQSIIASPILRYHFRVGALATVVDAVHGLRQLSEHEVTRRQVAVADRIVVSKADIAPEGVIPELLESLAAINGLASIIVSHNDANEEELKLSIDIESQEEKEVLSWFPRVSDQGSGELGKAEGPETKLQGLFRTRKMSMKHRNSPAHQYATLSVICEAPVDWVAFGIWLSMLVHRYGENILRVKGLMWVTDSDTPVAVHGVQTLIYPPTHLRAWPSAERVSRLVLIGDLPPAEQIIASLQAFSVSTAPFIVVND